MSSNDFLFDPDILVEAKLPVLDGNLKLRPLKRDDYERGFMDLLSQLTSVGQVSQDQFEKTFDKMKQLGCHYVFVIEDLDNDTVIGTAELHLEQKFIHDCGLRGRIEDVVVDQTYRERKLGQKLITTLKLLAKHLGCYKLTLDCSDRLRPWYEKQEFVVEDGRSNFMTIRLE